MSTPKRAKPDEEVERLRLLRRVGRELGREITTSTLFLHTLIATKVGLNATDTRCIEILARSGPEPITAGTLTKATGLTTGAITGILDRLERAGFVKRVRDEQDRRKVFVKLAHNEATRLTRLYEGLGSKMEQLATGYTIAELRLIETFLDNNLCILHEEIAKLSTD